MLFQKAVKVGEILRNRATRECWLVVQKSAQGIFVINLMNRGNQDPAPVMLILSGYTDHWQRDREIDDLNDWEAKQLSDKMPLVEKVEEAALFQEYDDDEVEVISDDELTDEALFAIPFEHDSGTIEPFKEDKLL